MQLNQVVKLLTLMWGCLLCVALLTPPVTAQICDRTDAIEELLLTELNNTDCTTVTSTQLEALTGTIDWSNQNISAISASDLDNLTGIETFDIADNNISTLLNDTFNTTDPAAISLANNNISVIQQNALLTADTDTSSLVVNLSSNAISSTTLSSAFLNTLKPYRDRLSMDLSNNSIATLVKADLNFTPLLLNLSHNQIGNFPVPTFDHVSNTLNGTQRLDLSYNQISSLASTSLVSDNWRYLNLSNNQLSNLTADVFASVNNLEHLDLGYNQLTSFNPASISRDNPNGVFSLVLDGNPLTLTANNFAGYRLDELYLRNANLTSVPSGTFTDINTVEVIYLNNNLIDTLVTDSFVNATNLTALYLDNNSLATLPDNLVVNLTDLVMLNLSNNVLTTIQQAAFNNLTATSIDLSSNNINSLPINLLGLHSAPETISSFNLADNQLPSNGWEITNVTWIEEGNQSFHLELSHALPINISVPLISSGGILNETMIEIASGDTISSSVSWIPLFDPLAPQAHIAATQTNIDVPFLSGFVAIEPFGMPEGICLHTSTIEDLLLQALGLNDCTTVTATQLEALTGILNWSNRNIKTVSNFDLNNLTGIETFDFSDNNLSDLVDDMFNNTNPVAISFANNNISSIATNALLTSDTTISSLLINLSSNALTSGSLGSSFLNTLEVYGQDLSIDLSNNSITTLVPGDLIFSPIAINLSHNQITSFPATTFDRIQLGSSSNNHTLDLSYNQLSSLLTTSLISDSWRYLDLSNNQLSNLPVNVFYNINNLRHLDLGYNNLTSFNPATISQDAPNGTFALVLDGNPLNLTASNFAGHQLDTLYLRDANLTSVPSGTFTDISTVEVIYLNNNLIDTLVTDSFVNATNLTALYLDNNSITTLPDNVFAQLSDLVTLNLSNNFLTAIQPEAFTNLTAINIDLANTSLTSLPINLLAQHTNPSAILQFDLTDNPVVNSSWEITNSSWVETTNNSYILQLNHALPQDITFDIASSTGFFDTTTVTITKGEVNSTAVLWTALTDTDTAHIQALTPQIDIPLFGGFIILSELGDMANTDNANVCARSQVVIDLLLNATDNAACEDVTVLQLTSLLDDVDWTSLNISNLSAIDTDYLFAVSSFDLSDNNLTTLVNGSFNQTFADVIVLADNNLSEIQTNALHTQHQGNRKMDYDLSNNAITSDTLASNFLHGLTSNSASKLSTVDLSNNNITTIDQSYFSNFSPVLLNLSHNQITELTNPQFFESGSPFANLAAGAANLHLDLSHNQISSLGFFIFNVGSWNIVNLSHNEITALGSFVFNNPGDIRAVDLSYNQIASGSISAMFNQEDNPVPVTFNLDGNPIDLAQTSYNSLILDKLSFRNSNLTSIPAREFAQVYSLAEVDLSNNNITVFADEAFGFTTNEDFDFISSVWLTNNSITTFPRLAFDDQNTIKQIHLDHNQIATLNNNDFSELGNTDVLNLSNNLLSVLPDEVFTNTNFTHIDLSNNNISTLPVNFLLPLANFPHNDILNLQLLNLSGNPIADNPWQIMITSWILDEEANELVLYLGHPLPVAVSFEVLSSTGTLSTDVVTIPKGGYVGRVIWTSDSEGAVPSVTVSNSRIDIPELGGYIIIPSFNGACGRPDPIPELLAEALDQSCDEITTEGLEGITSLDWSNKSITTIDDPALNDLANLSDLDLSYNNLTSMQAFPLSSIRLLKTLSLAHNNLSVISTTAFYSNEGPFIHIFADSSVDLSHNAITSTTMASMFLDTATTGSSAKNKINFAHNQITTLHQDYFSPLYFELLNLSHNEIVSFPANTFYNVKTATSSADSLELDLSHNSLTTLPGPSFIGDKWSVVDFSNNLIHTLSDDVFSNVSEIQLVNLSNNNLVNFNPNAFSQTSDSFALLLDLSGNPLQLSTANFAGLRLAHLDLSSSNINSITGGSFAQTTALPSLDLSNNALTTLQLGALDNLTATSINLSNNNINTLPLNLLAKHTQPQLITEFDVSNNALTDNSWRIMLARWSENPNGSRTLVLSHALPEDITINISSVNGQLDVQAITILSGDTVSQEVVWTKDDNPDSLIPFITPVPNQLNISALSGYIEIETLDDSGICTRHPAVQQLILAALNSTDCEIIKLDTLANITALDLSNQAIEDITIDDLSVLSGLTELNLSNNNLNSLGFGLLATTTAVNASFANNNISTISSTALITLLSPTQAVNYDFSNNSITSATFASGFLATFSDSTVIGHTFDLSNNQITDVTSSFFSTSASELNLSNNQIPAIPAGLFSAFSNEPTVDLDLSDNAIATIAAQSFTGANWQQIDLSNNTITSLVPTTFNLVSNLSRLDLSDNAITTINVASINQGTAATNLSLILDGNPLVLATQNFAGLTVDKLYLNRLTSDTIATSAFAGINNLTHIYLNQGMISVLASGAFANATGLVELQLSNNSVTTLVTDVFGSSSSLSKLYLNGNDIATIQDGFVAQLTNLTTLDLSNNALSNLSTAQLENLTAIDIDLSNNNIEFLPLNLLVNHTNPANITNFDLSNNSVENATWEVTEANWVQANQSFTLQLDHAVPNDITIGFVSTSGLVNITSVTIPTGSKVSNVVSWVPYIEGLHFHIEPAQNAISVPSLSGYISIDPVGSPVVSSICDRSLAMQSILLTILSEGFCAGITLPDLGSITDTDIVLDNLGLTELRAVDLNYLLALDNIDLSNNALTSLVDGILNETDPDAVNFSNNNISSIARFALMTNHEGDNDLNLNLSNNAITSTTLSSGFLTDTDDQKLVGGTFDLSNNLISDLQQSYFDFAPAKLDLSSNQVSTIAANAFDTVSSLVTLDLSNNSVTALLSGTFPANQTTLQNVNLSNNQINSLQNSSFTELPSLQLLDLSNNQISNYPAAAFANGSSVNLSMILDNNPLQLTANNFAANNIAHLYLRNAGLTNLAADTFAAMVDPFSIHLQNNNLTTFGSDVFTAASTVQELYMSQNNIATIGVGAFNALGNLSLLDLSNNAFVTVTSDDFVNLTATTIDLSNNSLTTLPENLLIQHNDVSTITSFNIADNQITDNTWEITNVSWIEGANNTYQLEIGHKLPVDIVVPISSSNGNLTVTSVTISKGNTTSDTVKWTAIDPLITAIHLSPAQTDYEIPQLSGYITIEELGTPSGICLRTAQIRDLILTALNLQNCLVVLPSAMTGLSGTLDWQDANISTIASSDFVHLSGIDTFDMADNNINALADFIFSATAPATVSFANNNISVIGSEALFTSVTSADDININLSSNAITTATLASGFLNAAGNKKFVGGSFDLSNNQIVTLAAASFTDFNPAQLYLNDNALTSIEDNAFASATDLQTLNLANNQLDTLTASTLSGLSALVSLDMRNNSFVSIDDNAWLGVPALQTLDLSDNQLTNLTAAWFNGLSATDINLSNNSIDALPLDVLINHSDPASITVFDISGNSVENWQITTATWSKLAGDNTQLVIAHALPMDITVSLTSETGTLNPTEVTILAGDTSSQVVAWTGDAGNALAVVPDQSQVNISVLNGFVSIGSIAEAPVFTGSVDNQTVVQDEVFAPIQLPIATGGDGALSYFLQETNTTNLITGLVFNATSRQLSGSVDTAGNYSLSYIAEDVDSDRATIVFTLEVLPNLKPQLPSDGQQVYEYIQDVVVNITLPESSVANGEIIYSLSDLANLPTGLSFNATERTISGNTSATGTYEFMYIATDSFDDDSDSLNITLQIIEQVAPTFDAADLFTNITMRADGAEFALQLPSATGGNGALTYSFTTDGIVGLPAGLIFNATTNMIEGQPAVFGEFNITVTIDDSDLADINDSDSFSFTLILLESLGFATDLLATYSIVSDVPFSVVLPEGTGGLPAYTYSLIGMLPAGLSFDSSSRTLSGTTNSIGNFSLQYQITDADNINVTQQTELLIQLLKPTFLSQVADLQIQLGQAINVTLPAVDTDGQIDITYSISGAPAGISFNAATRLLSGGATELGTHTIRYLATDANNQEATQSFDITVTANTAVLQDIMWRQALAIADQTVNSVKKRFTLVNQHRLPYVENANGIAANFQVTESNWLGLWLNSGSGSLANKDAAYSWDGSTGVTQIGVDFSGKDYLVGLTSESVSTSSSFTVTGDAFDYTGNLDISGLGLLSFYGGYYQPKYSVWAISSSGSGSADLSLNAEGSSSTLSSGVDYSMFAFGGSYKLVGIFDVGFEGITSAALDFSDNTISSVSSNSASRNKFFGSIDFGRWTNKSATPAAKKTRTRSRTSKSSNFSSKFTWSPKLALALRSDSGASSSSSGLEITASVQVEYSMLNFEFGTRNFSSGDFSESGQWLSFNLIPTGKAGLNFTHRQQLGNSYSAQNALLSDAALTDIVSGMHQDDTVSSISTIAYGWNIEAGSLQLYSKGESSYADSTATNLFQTKSDIRWEHIGLSFDSANSKYSWNAEADPTAISFKAKIRF